MRGGALHSVRTGNEPANNDIILLYKCRNFSWIVLGWLCGVPKDSFFVSFFFMGAWRKEDSSMAGKTLRAKLIWLLHIPCLRWDRAHRFHTASQDYPPYAQTRVWRADNHMLESQTRTCTTLVQDTFSRNKFIHDTHFFQSLLHTHISHAHKFKCCLLLTNLCKINIW